MNDFNDASPPAAAPLQPTQKKRSPWLYVGCGCLVLLLLIGGGIGTCAYFAYKAVADVQAVGATYLEEDPKVKEAFGDDVEATGEMNINFNNGEWTAKYTLKGAKGSGDSTVTLSQDGDEMKATFATVTDPSGNTFTIGQESEPVGNDETPEEAPKDEGDSGAGDNGGG